MKKRARETKLSPTENVTMSRKKIQRNRPNRGQARPKNRSARKKRQKAQTGDKATNKKEQRQSFGWALQAKSKLRTGLESCALARLTKTTKLKKKRKRLKKWQSRNLKTQGFSIKRNKVYQIPSPAQRPHLFCLFLVFFVISFQIQTGRSPALRFYFGPHYPRQKDSKNGTTQIHKFRPLTGLPNWR